MPDASLPSAVPLARWPGLGAWNLYFLGKFLLLAVGLLDFHALPNLLFAACLMVPLPGTWLRVGRQLLALPSGVALLYYDTWLPPFQRLLAQPGVLDFSWEYVLELLNRFIDWNLVGGLLLLLVAYLYLRHWLRLTSLSLAGLLWLAVVGLPSLTIGAPQSGVAEAAGGAVAPVKADSATLDAWLEQFFASEGQRVTRFPAARADEPPFDVLVLNICSLAWADLDAVGLRDNPLLARMDVIFERFDTATSYSGPAVRRVLRASCGQPSHAALYQPAPEQCLLFQNLAQLGFERQTLLNHNGHFDDLLDDITSQRMPLPALLSGSFPRALVGFDGSPIASDLDVLRGWWRQRQQSPASHVSLFYNSISLHDGNRVVTADGGTRSADYRGRAGRLLDDLAQFLDDLQRSGRRVVVLIVPEHGAALHGDRMQLSGMREIPTSAITHVPVGVKFVGMDLPSGGEARRVDTPSSYLALSELLARLYEQQGLGQAPDLDTLLENLPAAEPVAETAGAQVLDFRGTSYMRLQGQREWQPLPKENN
ncbi:MAG: cellulose biosynthesis protein BcsG [Aquipseudomonas alcaligenes]|uniref:Cellulose biosynthesis protein BcsG n=1 Tax=Aquipseudomonas alcaligenes TaxID=43263 RepID=A0A5C7VXR8_AQUAC|nr:MAG: cellulose biosynthesis protein BcsG [Pseudomonas alcaligenes]